MSKDVTQWLEALGLGKYAAIFAENDVDFRALPALSEQDLKELGVSLGHRRVLQQAIAGLSRAREQLPAHRASRRTAATDAGLAAWERHPGERKPVTMLFADITGSTTLTETLDAEEAHGLLYGATQRMCEAVENNRGTVCRFMGDGVMAMFGAPVASEQHAVDACEAALEMQRAIGDYAADIESHHSSGIKIRVGLHSGEVVVLTVGEGDNVEYDASGPTVPIAARMEQIAAPGEVYLTAATQALGAERVETRALEPVTVKGLSEPVPVFALRRVLSVEEARPESARTPFVGRRPELNQLKGMLDACVEERQGQTVYVRGDPGIGKTRLVEELASAAAAKDVSCHRGLVLPFGVGKGQDAIRALVRSLLRVAPGGGKTDRRRAAETALTGGRLESDQAVFLNDLLDLAQPVELRALYDAMDNATRNKGKQRAVSSLLTTASRRRPVLVIIEDVHWADAVTLAHLAALTRTVAQCAALLVMSSRVEGDQLNSGWRARTEDTALITIDLGPLRTQDSIALISEFVDSADPVAKTCLERAAGNPLFLEQLLRTAQEGSVTRLPDSIQSLVLARLDRLEPEDKRALQAASVIGQRFDTDLLCHLLATTAFDAGGLVEHNLVRREATGYLFAHALIQESVYASLLTDQRRDLHRRTAEWFADNDTVLYAQHLDRAADERAPLAYLEAARSQSTQYRTQQAIRLVQRGLEITASGTERFELDSFCGELLAHLGNVVESMESYRRCLTLAEDDAQRCRARIGLAGGMRIMDRLDEALETLEKAEAEARVQDLKPELVRLHHLRGNLYFPLGNIEGCVEQHRAALKYARELGSAEFEALALGGVADGLYAQGRMRSAHDYCSQCIDVSRRHGLGRVEVANLNMMGGGGTLHFLNELRAAFDQSLRAVEAAHKVGHDRGELLAHIGVSMVSLDLGDPATAGKHAELGLALARGLGAKRFFARLMQCQARVLMVEGRNADAVNTLEAAMSIARETGIGYVGAAILGTLALSAQAPEPRDQFLSEGEELLRAGCVGHNYYEFYRDAIENCLNIGDWQRVERYASALEAYTRAEPLGWSDFIIARGRALADHGRGKRDKATMSELERLRGEAESVGLKPAIPALDVAVASC
jgi:class 3 adenylate cyclase/tetratricopeptide (TPR) repeat protein